MRPDASISKYIQFDWPQFFHFHYYYLIAPVSYRNKNILFSHNLLPSSNVSDEIYETAFQHTISTHHINETTRWGLSQDCSLQKQLGEAAEGTGLAFIVFTQAIVELPGAPFWAVLFFTMLLSLGLGSQIGILEGMLCTLFDIDIFKRLRKEYVTGKIYSLQ